MKVEISAHRAPALKKRALRTDTAAPSQNHDLVADCNRVSAAKAAGRFDPRQRSPIQNVISRDRLFADARPAITVSPCGGLLDAIRGRSSFGTVWAKLECVQWQGVRSHCVPIDPLSQNVTAETSRLRECRASTRWITRQDGAQSPVSRSCAVFNQVTAAWIVRQPGG